MCAICNPSAVYRVRSERSSWHWIVSILFFQISKSVTFKNVSSVEGCLVQLRTYDMLCYE